MKSLCILIIYLLSCGISFADLKLRHVRDNSLSVPVGSVIPWYDANGSISVPDCWKLADGTQISDSRSPMNGHYTPNMSGDTYVTGTSTALNWSSGAPSVVGSSNNSLPDHTHTHSLTAAGQTYSGSTVIGTGAHNHSMTHSHTINSSGAHSHSITTGYGDSGARDLAADGDDSGGTSTAYTNSDGAHTHPVQNYVGNTGTVGSDHTHELSITLLATSVSGSVGSGSAPSGTDIRPKSIRMKYIMKICDINN